MISTGHPEAHLVIMLWLLSTKKNDSKALSAQSLYRLGRISNFHLLSVQLDEFSMEKPDLMLTNVWDLTLISCLICNMNGR